MKQKSRGIAHGWCNNGVFGVKKACSNANYETLYVRLYGWLYESLYEWMYQFWFEIWLVARNIKYIIQHVLWTKQEESCD